MLKIKNKAINVPVERILEELKKELKSKGVYRFNYIKRTGNNLQVTCPIHSNGNEHKPSCGILLEDKQSSNGIIEAGTCSCFTCHYRASFAKMISDIYGIKDNGKFGEQWLLERFPNGELYQRDKVNVLSRETVEPRQSVSETELQAYRWYHPYMYKRKLTDEIISKFDIGFDKNTNCITFPTNDEFGNCLFITRRSVDGKAFNYPKDVIKPVYGLDKVPKNCKEIVVCESCINALTCWVYGKPAVALLGLGTREQYEILKKTNIRKFILAFDGDSAGYQGSLRFINALKSTKFIERLQLPKGKDINDLTKEEFEILLKNKRL